ncbi:PIN domain-like protein [Sanghuangporus baumii]|uniref:PIN domain-like protein n=1 Tax=Sanghuangporus baumii TaxID=108892 RepID=A0A9Q5HZG5_SANBA|nr:PIN domain-like protein [Sanghuangporus baumii]
MGVQGLTPFLQRYCPRVLKVLPHRLQGFDGKTIVLDGTLITHRFHYAPSPYEHRHVLGWYRTITELRDNNVNAICVFDGVGRSDAKLLENERRQSSRRLDHARWTMEVERYERLRALRSLIDGARWLPMDQRMISIARLEDMLRERREKSRETSPIHPDFKLGQNIDDILVALESFIDEYDINMRPEYEDDVFVPPDLSEIESLSLADESVIEDQDFLYPDERTPLSNQSYLSEQLGTPYKSHEASSKASQTITLPIDPSIVSPEEVSESRKQLSLSYDENLLWNKIPSLIAHPRFLRTPPLLVNLLQRCKILCESYKKRASPPTEETYKESRMILEALGVPCIESRGQYEAEGLAAALVRRGLAHFVASEDTDVLVYGAPLLRNVSSRSGAIISISSEEVRRALCLSRAAFMDFALLIGTDFIPRVRNVGPVRALGFIYEHSRIERVVKHESRYVPEDVPSYLEKVRQARNIFTKLPPVPPKHKLQPGKVDKERVTELLDQFGLARVADDNVWDPEVSFGGNYFDDHPAGEGTANTVSTIRFSK